MLTLVQAERPLCDGRTVQSLRGHLWGARTEWLVSPAGDVQTLVLQESIRIAMATRLWEFREAAASAHDYKKLLQVLFLPVRGPRAHPEGVG